jgi:hypothetical protein
MEKKKEIAKDKKKRKVPIEPDDQVEYRSTKRKKKMEEGAKKSNSGPLEENLTMTTTC